MCVEAEEYMLIHDLVHGMFYRDVNKVMCFMRIDEIPNDPTSHMF